MTHEQHDEVSVLFADISGFVAGSLGASRSSTFSTISSVSLTGWRHSGVEDQAIGDAYMAVAGLPGRCLTERLARMALDMLATVERVRVETGLALQIRISGWPVSPG